MPWIKSVLLGMASVALAAPQVVPFPMGNGTTTSPSSTTSQTSTSSTSSTTSTGGGGVILPPITSGPTTTTSDIVTSTLTVPPPALSTEKATNTQWSSNTWVTTSKDGQPTIVPVIVGCPGCGPIAAGAGIIIWGFPPIPATVFSFAGFPGLPPFHLPCIKIFGISAGNCPSDPVDDSGTENDPDNHTKTNDPDQTDTKTDDKDTSTESRESTSTTSSSSSSCATRTATDCTVACVTGATSSCSTVCATVTACSATGSTTTTSSGGVCTKDPGNAQAGQVQEWSYDGFAAFTVPNPFGSMTSMTSQMSTSTTASQPTTLSTSTLPTKTSTSTSSSSSTSGQSSSTGASSSSSTGASASTSSSLSTSGQSSSTGTSTGSTSSTAGSSSISPTTTLPPRTAAPDITVTPTYTPDCVQGYSTLTMPAVMSAPANAASLKFIIPKADTIDSNWKMSLLKGFVNDPADQVKTWQVGSDTAGKTGPLIASGNGGQGMDIKWQTPKGNENVYVELLFIDGLGIQTNGVSLVGDGFTCMPSSCSGPPKISETETSICSLPPCSNNPVCTPKPLVPHAACDIFTDGLGIIPLWYEVTIYTNNWVTDNGDKLRDEEDGCGELLSWNVQKVDEKIDGGAWTATNAYSFTLPLTIKSGCVERAIKSAGGPDGLQCFNYDVTDWGNPFGGIGI